MTKPLSTTIANCSACPAWSRSNGHQNIGLCAVNQEKTLGHDIPSINCEEAVAKLPAIDPENLPTNKAGLLELAERLKRQRLAEGRISPAFYPNWNKAQLEQYCRLMIAGVDGAGFKISGTVHN